MSSPNDDDSSDYIDESDCIIPSSGSIRFIRAEYELSERKKGWWENRPQKPGQNEKRRDVWVSKLANYNSLFDWSSKNHPKTVGGIEQAKAKRKRLEDLVNEAPPF